jgi:DinB superfamily
MWMAARSCVELGIGEIISVEELFEYRHWLLEHFSAVAGEFERRLAALSSAELHAPLNHSGNSRHWLMAHLRATEENLFLVGIRRILAESRPALDEYDRLAWMQVNYDPQEPVARLLSDFAKIRTQELDCLRNMPPDGWNRIGRHLTWGDRTLQWWVEQSQVHSVSHLHQLVV